MLGESRRSLRVKKDNIERKKYPMGQGKGGPTGSEGKKIGKRIYLVWTPLRLRRRTEKQEEKNFQSYRSLLPEKGLIHRKVVVNFPKGIIGQASLLHA